MMKRKKIHLNSLAVASAISLLVIKLLILSTISVSAVKQQRTPPLSNLHHAHLQRYSPVHNLNNHQLYPQYAQQQHHQIKSDKFLSSSARTEDNNQDLMVAVSNTDESYQPRSGNSGDEEESGESADSNHDESADDSQEAPERNMFMDHHNSRLRAMHDLFERRQLNNHQLQSSQELSPISIGLDPVTGVGAPFNMPPFAVPNHDGPSVPHSKALISSADSIDQGLGPSLPFGLSPLPHLLGFQNTPFDGPQRGDQSAHVNHHTTDTEVGTQKVWPKIFRFTDGRINLSDFEKQKKIKLSSKNQHSNENHIESAPIIFDGRQLKRKSFLILHGGIFSR